MRIREWLWRRKWSTVSEERIAEIIAEISPKYGVKYVAFRSDSPDGTVRPKDSLDVYVVNNGGMSYCDLAHFSGEVMCAMNRDADFHPMGRRTERSELEELGYIIAFEESVIPDTGKCRSKDESGENEGPVQLASSSNICQAGPKVDEVEAGTSSYIRLNDPPGINPGLIRRAVEIVVETCSPRLVYLVGPTSVGYVEQGKVELVVIIDRGNKMSLQGDIVWALTDEFIDGDVGVYTLKEFEECRDDSWTSAYRAAEYGRIAYERDSAVQLIDSEDAFYEYVMEGAPRVDRKDSERSSS